MSTRRTCAALPSTTISPVSADGVLPCDSPAGPTNAPLEPEAAHVSRFRARESKKAMSTNDTSGPLFSATSPSSALQRSLANKLEALLAGSGSPLFVLTWKDLDMPSGGVICQLRASARRTSGSASSGAPADTWPTPQSRDGAHSRGGQIERTGGRRRNLDDYVTLSPWTTPSATDGERGGTITPEMTGSSLTQMAAGWPTATARDHFPAHTREYIAAKKAQGHGMANLNDAVSQVSPWATPTASDWKGAPTEHWHRKDGKLRNDRLDFQAALGQISPGSPAPTEKRGQLNPDFSRWLMGYPVEWGCCAATVTRSSRKNARSS